MNVSEVVLIEQVKLQKFWSKEGGSVEQEVNDLKQNMEEEKTKRSDFEKELQEQERLSARGPEHL